MADQSNEMGMVERVARAICASDVGEGGWRELAGEGRDVYRQNARAAIEAMREPSEEMKKRWLDLMEDWVTEVMPDTYDPYRAMIDEALKPAALSHDEVKG